jgi:hypothetical protein
MMSVTSESFRVHVCGSRFNKFRKFTKNLSTASGRLKGNITMEPSVRVSRCMTSRAHQLFSTDCVVTVPVSSDAKSNAD